MADHQTLITTAAELARLLESMGEESFVRYYGQAALEAAKAPGAGWREATVVVEVEDGQAKITGRLRE
jgi:hypothetical protein